MNTSFFGELLQTITDRGRALLGARAPHGAEARSQGLVDLCEELLSGRGEASGVALAREILTDYRELTVGPRIAFFEALAERFGPDRERIDAAVAAWTRNASPETAAELHLAAEPRRQELFRRLNLAPGGTAALVAMREDLLEALPRRDDLAPVDHDFVHLFSSWFNRGFLVLRHIDWSTPAIVLEKIIRYEAVHQIQDWNDLRRRIDPPDRRCYAFFHPALVDEPLIFVEVALVPEIAGAIAPLIDKRSTPLAAEQFKVAVFYSISNCQPGLRGVSLGNFLIKRVADELKRELPQLKTFCTLSPIPTLVPWLARLQRADSLPSIKPAQAEAAQQALAVLRKASGDDLAALTRAGSLQMMPAEAHQALWRLAALYLVLASPTAGGDPVARFHLDNGARLERLNANADLSAKGLRQSAGLMVNYLYDLGRIEANHDRFVAGRAVHSRALSALLA